MEFIRYEIKEDIAVITIDRQKALNALNMQVLDELRSTFIDICMDSVRCVIITGAGKKSFVAGADISAMQYMSRRDSRAFSVKGNRVFRRIEKFELPVIAAVNGFALGGGCELAMACDLRIASENAIFGLPEVSLGIPSGFGGTQRLARIVGLTKAKEMLYTAKRITAKEALDMKLLNAVYPQEDLMEETFKLAKLIAQNAPIAVRATKAAIGEGMQVGIDAAIDIEADKFSSCFESIDQVETMSAFLEKRKPNKFLNR